MKLKTKHSLTLLNLTSFCLNTGETGHVLIAASDQRTCSQLREVCITISR